MSHPSKKQRLDDGHQRNDAVVAAGNDYYVTFDDLSVDVLANIFGFLSGAKEIMCKRRINKKTMEAVKKTIVPLTDLSVNSVENYNAMVVMTRAMPNLQQITIGNLGRGHKYSDGGDPDEELADETAHYTAHDIRITSNFSKLRILEIDEPRLNGRYPFLFSSFPLLQKLTIRKCYYLKWDLEILAGLSLLKELECEHNHSLIGNIRSFRVLKDTLEKVHIPNGCGSIEGSLMDLADFPNLKELDLWGTAVTGDIRDIGEKDFSSLEQLILPNDVYGARGSTFQRIADGPDLVRAVYLLKKQHPTLSLSTYSKKNDMKNWYVRLSEDSPDWYGSADDDTPPFCICFVEGSRVGYRWFTWRGKPCEVNWLDPEPERESSDYAKYIEELQHFNSQVGLYRGFHQPPTEEEYNRLHDR